MRQYYLQWCKRLNISIWSVACAGDLVWARTLAPHPHSDTHLFHHTGFYYNSKLHWFVEFVANPLILSRFNIEYGKRVWFPWTFILWIVSNDVNKWDLSLNSNYMKWMRLQRSPRHCHAIILSGINFSLLRYPSFSEISEWRG